MAIYIHQVKVRILSSVVIALNVLVTATLCTAETNVLAGKAFALASFCRETPALFWSVSVPQ